MWKLYYIIDSGYSDVSLLINIFKKLRSLICDWFISVSFNVSVHTMLIILLINNYIANLCLFLLTFWSPVLVSWARTNLYAKMCYQLSHILEEQVEWLLEIKKQALNDVSRWRFCRNIVTYACGFWKKLQKNQLMVFERKVLRRITGPTKEREGLWRIKTNDELDELIRHKNIINHIEAQRLSWFGHLHRMPEERMVKKSI